MAKDVLVSNKKQQVTNLVFDNIEVIRLPKLFRLKIDGDIYMETFNLKPLLLPLSNRDLAKIIEEAFLFEKPTPRQLMDHFKGWSMKITYK